MSPPTANEARSTDALAKAFADAGEDMALGDEDRVALLEAARDPRWKRLSRGDAFEHLLCEREQGEEDS